MAENVKLSQLTSEQISVLIDVVNRVKNLPLSTNRPAVEITDHQAPEVYIVRTPQGGIPALTRDSGTGRTVGTGTDAGISDRPGIAQCSTYLAADVSIYTEFTPMDMPTIEVLNFAECAIAGNKWILAVRDKPGRWFAIDIRCTSESGTGTTIPGTGTVGYIDVTVVTNVCPIFDSGTGSYSLGT